MNTQATKQQQMQKQQTPIQEVETSREESGDAFRKRNRILRSPPQILGGNERPTEAADIFLTPSQTEANKLPAQRTPAVEQSTTNKISSPKQEFIVKMRSEEEEALAKCRLTLRKIKSAMVRQKNISADVKAGVSELDELFDIIGSLRRNWLKAEKESKQAKIAKTTEAQTDPSDMSTPTMKRLASSPAEQGTRKRGRGPEDPDWKEVVGRRKRKQNESTAQKRPQGIANEKPRKIRSERKPRERPEAALIKPAEGSSYAEVLQNLRQCVMSDENKTEVRAIRKTKTGALLLEMDKGEKATPEFWEALKSNLHAVASVTELKPKVTIEIRDLDSLTTAQEVSASVKRLLEEQTEEITVRTSAPNSREQIRAFVTLSAKSANDVLKKERVKIGWINCKMRLLKEVKKCYRCFGFGHLQWECRGPDRKGQGLCIRCGKPGHKIKECKNTPSCCLCIEKGYNQTEHIPGSRICTLYRGLTEKL